MYSGDSALSPASRLLATTIMFNGIQWYDVNNRKAVTTKQSEENNLNVILPVIFISGTTIAVGSAIGNVSIFKFGKAEPTQILKHHGKVLNTSSPVLDSLKEPRQFCSSFGSFS